VDLDVGPSGPVIDRDVEVVIAVAAMIRASGGPSTELVATTGRDPPEFLHVDVDEFAGMVAFVADRDRGGPIEMREPREPFASEHRVDGRPRMSELVAETVRPELRPTPGADDAPDLTLRQRVGASTRC
jgi:hypothetical protein